MLDRPLLADLSRSRSVTNTPNPKDRLPSVARCGVVSAIIFNRCAAELTGAFAGVGLSNQSHPNSRSGIRAQFLDS